MMNTQETGQDLMLVFAYSEIHNLKLLNRWGIVRNYLCACNSFTRYLHSLRMSDIPLRSLTSDFLFSYQEWLWKQGVSRNSSSCYMRNLHAIYNKAVRKKKVSGNPFADVYTGVCKTRKRAISATDINRLRSLNVGLWLLEKGKRYHSRSYWKMRHDYEFARDMFLFCFATRGMTFVDLAYLRRSDFQGGYITYTRRKTRQAITIKVEPVMQVIIDRYSRKGDYYLFPILTSTNAEEAYRQYRLALRDYNSRLRVLSTFLDADVSLSSYVSRHTWATLAYHQQMPVSIISQAMGHDSERTTQIYLKSFDGGVIDRANRSLLEQIFT